MKLKVGVIDYGMGNLHSVAKAISLQGGDVFISSSPRKLKTSDLLVLPGVGAFGAAMKTLARKKLDTLVESWVAQDRPYLGICLGFQLLFDRSEENSKVRGLSLMKGDVVRFRPRDFKGKDFQIPHMGWNTADLQQKGSSPLLKGISPSDRFYFVHSYFPVPKDKKVIFSQTRYGLDFCSSVKTGRLFACQFHPEKSGAVGLKLLKNIMSEAR